MSARLHLARGPLPNSIAALPYEPGCWAWPMAPDVPGPAAQSLRLGKIDITRCQPWPSRSAYRSRQRFSGGDHVIMNNSPASFQIEETLTRKSVSCGVSKWITVTARTRPADYPPNDAPHYRAAHAGAATVSFVHRIAQTAKKEHGFCSRSRFSGHLSFGAIRPPRPPAQVIAHNEYRFLVDCGEAPSADFAVGPRLQAPRTAS